MVSIRKKILITSSTGSFHFCVQIQNPYRIKYRQQQQKYLRYILGHKKALVSAEMNNEL